MKLNVSSSELLKGLMDISKAIPAKSALPILENFLFDLKGNILEVTASDSELTLRTEIEVDTTEEEGRIAVPARHIIDLLKELPDQPVSICTASDSSIECKWTSGNSVLPFFPAEDYPEIKGTCDDAEKLEFPAESLIEGINSTIYATADDEIRPAMNGIFFDFGPESTTLVASDSHKLICYTAKEVKTPEKCSFILHKKPAAVLKSILGKDDGTVEIAFDSSTVLFTFGKTTMVCRLIVGKYPQVPRCDPSEQLQRAEDRQGDVLEHGKACGRLRQQGFQPHQAGSQAGTDGDHRTGSRFRHSSLREDQLRLPAVTS